MGFQNPVSGAQGALERQQIKSPNYVTGSAGWAIKRDGSAEFNNIKIRGASTVGGEALWYNGTPANGNLLFSIAANPDTDPYGNHIAAGAVSYTHQFTSDVGMNNGVLSFGSAAADFANSSTLQSGLTAGGALIFNSGTGDANHTQAISGGWYSGLPGQTSGKAHTPNLYISAGIGNAADFYLSGAVVRFASAGGLETWQTPSLASGWSAGTVFNGLGGDGLQYRHMAEDDVWLLGLLTASSGASTIPVTLPAGYRPATGTPHGTVNRERSGTVSTVECAITTAGQVILSQPIAAGDNYSFNFRIPLRNVA